MMLSIEIVATICFGLAILHTFLTGVFHSIASRFPEGSKRENFFHYLAEIEVVFGLWSFVFIGIKIFYSGVGEAISFLESVHYTEPLFVFVIMAIAATKPLTEWSMKAIQGLSHLAPKSFQNIAWYFACLTIAPLLGSFITEPAAMALTVIMLLSGPFRADSDRFFKYSTLAVLFVNISIGGTLTHFAAPPIIVVAQKWDWTLGYVFSHFGWKGALVVFVNAVIVTTLNLSRLKNMQILPKQSKSRAIPFWVFVVHILFLSLVVYFNHYIVVFIPVFLLFLGWHDVTAEFQDPLKLKESLLVGFFLGGLVTLGSMQAWWIQPLIESTGYGLLFIGATTLTAVTDNAALTYLATLVPNISEEAKYAVVAGAVSGGGLTVIANAPNPVGFGLVKSNFGGSMNHALLFVLALPFTVIACLAFWFL